MAFSIQENVSLQSMNTFGLAASARYFCVVDSLDALQEALAFARSKSLEVFILGGGSNIVLLNDLDLLVVSIQLKGITYLDKQVRVMAGENWHLFVRQMIDKNRYGLENLSYIPGLVGAAPVQNIGAYGVEVSERLVSVSIVDKENGKERVLCREECAFSYRDSIFKRELRNKFIITSITLELDDEYLPVLIYADLKKHFGDNPQPSALEVSDALIEIRSKKLPSPSEYGNAGSFFKNPILTREAHVTLSEQLSLSTINDSDSFKVSAALLISRAGLQGKQIGGAAVSEQHALVIINKNKASCEDVIRLTSYIQDEVYRQYNVLLEVEPEIIR